MSSAPSAAAAAASGPDARGKNHLALYCCCVAFFLVLGALWAKPERWMDDEEVRVVEGVPFAGASDPQDAFFDPFAAQHATPSTLAAGRRRERAVRRQQNAFFFNPFGHTEGAVHALAGGGHSNATSAHAAKRARQTGADGRFRGARSVLRSRAAQRQKRVVEVDNSR